MRGELPPGCSGTRAGGEPLKTGSPCSVHAAVAPFLRSVTVSVPAAIARLPHRRRADQNAVLHRARQNRPSTEGVPAPQASAVTRGVIITKGGLDGSGDHAVRRG